MTLLTALALWLHDLATVILIGHYLLLLLVYLPLLKTEFSNNEVGSLLRKIIQQVQPWMGLSLLVFVATGILLMFANPSYLGVGNFGNPWSIFMLIKHIVVIGMIALASWITVLTRPAMAARAAASNPHPKFIYNISAIIQVQAGIGMLVLLLTALARMG